MANNIKYKVYDKQNKQYIDAIVNQNGEVMIEIDRGDFLVDGEDRYEVCQNIGIKDKDGNDIYFYDIVRFDDKWEWYRTEWVWKLMGKVGDEREKLIEEYNNLPYEERTIDSINDYDWLLSSEIQTYWKIVGNKFEGVF